MDAVLAGDTLGVLLMATVRLSAFFVVAPPFASRAVPARVKAALAFAIALLVAPRLKGQGPSLDLAGLLGGAAYQVLVGATMGFVVYLAFSAVQAAGELVDLASGFTLSSLYDPMTNVSSSLFGRVQALLATTLLFASGGHLLLVRGLVTTFQMAPLRPLALGDVGRLVTDGLGRFLTAALEIAAPVMVVLFLAELALGLVSRAVPTLNLFAVGFPVKILLAVSLSGVALALLPGAVSRLVGQAALDVGAVARMLGSQ